MISSVRNFVVRILDADRFTIALFQILDIKSNYLPGIVHATSILHADKEGPKCQESLNYPSVIVQLDYLAQNSRYPSPYTNAQDSLKTQKLYMKKQSNA
jgi:hypothetical protein